MHIYIFMYIPQLLIRDTVSTYCHFFYCKDFIYLFLERGKGRRKTGRETSVYGCLSCIPPLGTWPVTQACVL